MNTQTPPPDYHVFPNGSSYRAWRANNCDRCWKRPGPDIEGRNTKCVLESAIALGSATDGTLRCSGTWSDKKASAMLSRLGYNEEEGEIAWDCPERQEHRPKPKTQRTAKDQGILL